MTKVSLKLSGHGAHPDDEDTHPGDYYYDDDGGKTESTSI